MTAGFKYCALYYLNQCISKDRGFCRALKSQNALEQLSGLARAAAFYRVARNLPSRHDVDKKLRRYEPVLKIISSQHGPLSADAVLTRVKTVRDQISKEYGDRGVLSLTTKFLWLRFRSPVIIYDSQVRRALGTRPGNIDDYYTCWDATFKKHSGDIRAACGSLNGVREYCIEPEALGAGPDAVDRWRLAREHSREAHRCNRGNNGLHRNDNRRFLCHWANDVGKCFAEVQTDGVRRIEEHSVAPFDTKRPGPRHDRRKRILKRRCSVFNAQERADRLSNTANRLMRHLSLAAQPTVG